MRDAIFDGIPAPMTKIGKVLVVFTTAAALAMLGFASVTVIGGPNWEAESEELSGYTFSRTTGEQPVWEVTDSVTGQKVGQGTPVLAAAILAARKHLREKQNAEIRQIEGLVPPLNEEATRAKSLIEKDLAALTRREELITAELDDLGQQADTVSNEGVQKTQQATELHNEVVRRREDVYRLEGELAAVRADKYRAIEQYKKLRDSLIRTRLVASTLEERKLQLEGGAAPVDQPVNEGPAAGN